MQNDPETLGSRKGYSLTVNCIETRTVRVGDQKVARLLTTRPDLEALLQLLPSWATKS
jgi:hypothetical protein